MSLNRLESAGYMTNWASRLFARAIDQRLRPIGLASGQLPVLFALDANPAMSQKQLAQAAAIEQPTMAATLSRMERDGLIGKRRDPKDARSMLYSLTPLAMEKAAQVRAAIKEVNEVAMGRLEEKEHAAYLALLEKIVGALETSLDGTPD